MLFTATTGWILLLTAALWQGVLCTDDLDVQHQPWSRYIYAPDSRTPRPHKIFRTHGKVNVHGLDVTLSPKSQVTYDFGREVGGHVRFLVNSPSSTKPLSLSFSESPQFIGEWSDDTGASPFSDWDRSLTVSIPPSGLGTSFKYTTPRESFRGGFRYLTITSTSNLTTTPVKISNVICLLGFHPGVENPQTAYRGYFWTPYDALLVRTWYAGAYTVQTNIALPDTGRFLPQVRPGWAYNASLGVVSTGAILVDGAKRDRAVWPGDLGISAPSSYIAFGPKYGYECVLNALETLFYFQNETTGTFPFAGPDTNSFRSGSKSDTYHSWSLIAIEEYAFYSGDMDWVNLHWNNITRAVEAMIGGITEQGLQNQTNTNDWAREGGGGLNSALNAVSYGMLTRLSNLASLHGDSALSSRWRVKAEELKSAFNALLWDDEAGLYRDNTTTMLHPQDGNSLAVVYNLTTSNNQKKRISQALTMNWNEIGPVTPELKDTISLFVSSWELNAHFEAEEPDRALELVRRLWGYSLDGPNMGGTTIVEGLSANGSLYYRSEAGYGYDPAYTSLAHSWSTGPTHQLITRLLGLSIVSSQGRHWEMIPNIPTGSRECVKELRGGFETKLGMFEAEWKVIGRYVQLKVKTPKGTSGKVGLNGSKAQIVEVKGDGGWKRVILRLE
ncbi:hypothetical protein E1B28_005251 [Marasmius oreades]|uniref:Alpha-L-rhamnosidase six-hairpin glycosidase domain-containing protein n=1 Tax=Marasmius oreades TaxID=181124 RepID=A0A9P7V0G4_9AGAR|nr:uncharacterized protein E1B28_005251 [Marasmius oreades]KAG7097940.1 hypothetical protein E1B28_005251 [Marasmius oreades]